ncbi:hypothetical protein C8R43DRAFT_906248 [Mycena crocata]|nr:hypothetical protein C8R43DRAFT_906248 [Mycena crocata]
MAETALGCAQNADGSLRDASQITFYNDRDDDVPITGPEASSSTQLHPFFTGSAKPLGKVAGSRRRSSRTTRPSARMADPNNAESSVSAGKRKAVTVMTASRKMPRRSTGTASEPEGNNESDEDSDGSAAEADDNSDDEEGEGQEVMDLEQYNSIQTMADADHAHAVAKAPGADSTADVRTVFTRIKGRMNPKTGNSETGAECKICVENGNEKTLLTGSVTSLRYHIARTKGHYQIYKARCDKLGIELNERAIPKTPNNWEMKTVELAFMKIEGRHTGQTLGAALVQTIQRYGLEKKTGWITSDGASVNRTTARAIERELAPHDPTWTAEERDMMCMEHAVHTGCKHFVDTVAPTPPKTLHKKIRELLDDAYNKGDIDQADVAKAIDRFTLIADSSEEVPPLRNRLYSDYRLTLPEWERLDMIRDALREPADVTQTFSKERYPTVSIIIPTFEYLIIRWETMSMHPRYAEISDALKEGVKSFRKWYHRAETTSNAYFICLGSFRFFFYSLSRSF